MTTKYEIGAWFDRGLADPKKPTHLLVVVDGFDHEDYPVFVYPTDKVHEVYNQYNGPNMQRVMEVYNLRDDKEHQLNEFRASNF
jgi:hypothetical protein